MDDQASGTTDISHDETLRRIDASWTAWLEAVAGVAADRLSEPGACDDWSVKDLIGHVAYWDADALADIERITTGVGEQPGDTQNRNEASAAANAGRTLDDLRAEMARNHDAVLVALRGLPPDDPRTRRICREIAEDSWQHYDEHAAQVRAWRARQTL